MLQSAVNPTIHRVSGSSASKGMNWKHSLCGSGYWFTDTSLNHYFKQFIHWFNQQHKSVVWMIWWFLHKDMQFLNESVIWIGWRCSTVLWCHTPMGLCRFMIQWLVHSSLHSGTKLHYCKVAQTGDVKPSRSCQSTRLLMSRIDALRHFKVLYDRVTVKDPLHMTCLEFVTAVSLWM